MSAPSLQRRLLLTVLAAVTLVWLAAAALTWRDARHELDELLDAHLAQAASLLMAQQANGDFALDDDDELDAPVLHRYAARATFQVWVKQRLVVRSPNAGQEPLTSLRSGFETRRVGKEDWRVFAAQAGEGKVRVLVGEQMHSRNEILRAVLRGLLAPLLIALPLIALAVWLSIRAALRPLRRLRHALAARAAQDLSVLRLAGATPSEMQPLVETLNQLFARIEQMVEGERRFTADAAHELRTPIAAIRAQAQVALGATDDAGRRHALEATLAGCDRASHLVQQLLTLSRLEAAAAPSAAAPPAAASIDLAAVARKVIAGLAPAALARGQCVALQAPAACALAADETLTHVLLRNLLDNALRYSPPGARIDVAVSATASAVALQVDDSGPGLCAADVQRLGERFFRVLGAEASGSGLGWSIVRRIAAAQGAQVSAGRSAALGGLSVQVRWPTAG